MKNIKKVIIILVIIILIVLIAFFAMTKLNNSDGKATSLSSTDEINVVPTMRDKITEDSTWCATFQLVWNDMKNEVVKQDIVFSPQLESAKNLNLEDFTSDMISDDYYFKAYGLKTLELKEEIENGIKEKFDQTSDILDYIDWSDETLDSSKNQEVQEYIFYAMLYREFGYSSKFDKLDNGDFADGKYTDIEYFGIDSNTQDSVGDQIDVLYYNSQDDFALIINTTTDDEIIFCKSPKGKNFNEIYENMLAKAESYDGSKDFEDVDEFKAPNLDFDILKEYSELENKTFETNNLDYPYAKISMALQSIKFSLDEAGGQIKSEAALHTGYLGSAFTFTNKEPEPRYFYVDDTFALFLKEEDKDLPYFAARIDDITKFQ